MSKYNSSEYLSAVPRGVLKTTKTLVPTHEGGQGYERTPRSELFLTAITEMAEDTFYEKASDRRDRIRILVAQVLQESDGRAWMGAFLPWLRNTAQMRSAPVILLAEMAAAGAQGMRPLVAQTLSRADEPGELLGYWLQFHGRSIPAGLKRGIADAAVKLYTERNALKWDGNNKAIRFGDVIDLTHPVPSTPWQSDLFKQLLDDRHNRQETPSALTLPLLNQDFWLQRITPEGRRDALPMAVAAGWSWERLAGWLPGGMDSEAWEAVIPNMGYMALLRNLRNFEEAGVSKAVLKGVAAKLVDPNEVKNSRQFPYRFLQAYLANKSLTFGTTLEDALELSLDNVPALVGKTLVLIDTSGSMDMSLSDRSQATRTQVAALFGVALGKTGDVDVVLYATNSMPFKVNPAQSTLRLLDEVSALNGQVGHGTNTHQAVRDNLRPEHKRVIILTDEQSRDSSSGLPGNPWVHVVNLAGYRAATMAPSAKTFSYGGFTDQMFKLISLMENGASGRWPWEV